MQVRTSSFKVESEKKYPKKLSASEKTQLPKKEWEKLKKENISVTTINNEDYPQPLREIPTAPFLLYSKSNQNLDLNSSPMISIVGSRKITSYGKQVAYRLAYDLAKAGITIVSGMALGVDAIAHRGALGAEGKTVAVLGSGLNDDKIGPRTNFQLSRKIMSSGALVSDFHPETTSSAGTFPARNRIMAGMTLGTIVIEAAQKSGTLITANLALDFNREIFAVPGSIFSPMSQGSNKLIQAGAKLVSNAQDVLEELGLESFQEKKLKKQNQARSNEEELILKVLKQEPCHVDKIIKITKLNSNVIISNLTMLEIKGIVKNIGGNTYIII